MDKYEEVVKSLQERSQHVLPLRYRRETPPQPVPVEALCEYDGEQVTSPSSRERCRGAAGNRLLRGRRGWKRYLGKEQFLPAPKWRCLPQWGQGEGRAHPGGKAGFAAQEEQHRRGLGETQPPSALRTACLSHTLQEVATARLHHVPTLPALGRWRCLCTFLIQETHPTVTGTVLAGTLASPPSGYQSVQDGWLTEGMGQQSRQTPGAWNGASSSG